MLESAHPLAISGFVTIAIGLVVLLSAYFQARSKNFKNHRRLMIFAVITLSLFLIQYLIRLGILREETHFEGDEIVKVYIYLPILIIHITTAIITLGLIIVHGRKTLLNQKFSDLKVPYFPKEYRNIHRSQGTKVFYFWLLSYMGGILVFILLYLL